jgi:hypothetical protein
MDHPQKTSEVLGPVWGIDRTPHPQTGEHCLLVSIRLGSSVLITNLMSPDEAEQIAQMLKVQAAACRSAIVMPVGIVRPGEAS